MFRNRHKQTASAIKTISLSLDLFPSKHSTEHAVLRFSFSHLFICVFVCLCVWKSEDTMWVPELDSGHRVSQQAPLSALSPVLFFFLNRKSPLYLLIEQNQNIPNILKSNHKILLLVTLLYCYLWGLLCSVTISTKKWRWQVGYANAQTSQQCCGTALPFTSPILSLK